MKKYFTLIAIAAVFAACNNEGNKTSQDTQDAATAGEEATSYTVDPAASVIHWKGAKITQTEHMGTVQIKEGSLTAENGNLTSGNFVVDMTTITNTDLTAEDGKAKLEGHLKSGDFFAVDSFPTASFEITGVEKTEGDSYNVSGNLTIRGITHGVTFPATVGISEDKVEAKGNLLINRNEWNVRWGGSKESSPEVLGFLGDNLVKDNVELEVHLSATAK